MDVDAPVDRLRRLARSDGRADDAEWWAGVLQVYLDPYASCTLYEAAGLPTLSEGELLALSGKFLDRHMITYASFIAAFARGVGWNEGDGLQGLPEASDSAAWTAGRLDPKQFWKDWLAREKDLATPSDDLPSYLAGP
jgi:hypothetical protein